MSTRASPKRRISQWPLLSVAPQQMYALGPKEVSFGCRYSLGSGESVLAGDFLSAVTPLTHDLKSDRSDYDLWNLVVRRYWWCFGAVLALISWNSFWRLWDTFVRDCDEGRYGVAASEMLHSHSMLVTTYAGETEFWNLKPPLGYWLLDLSYWVLGETTFALRAPAAICAVLTATLTMLAARKVADASVSLLAGLMLATCFGFLGNHAGRSGDLDAPLALLVLLFVLLAPRMCHARAARVAAGLVLSLGFLLKSFAILPYIVAVAVYLLIVNGRTSWRVWPLPLAITATVVATWAAARTLAEGSSEFVQRMFIEDLLLRSTTMIDEGGSSIWDYPGALFDRMAPWPLVVLVALVLSRRFAQSRLSSDFAILMWCWALIPFVLFSAAQTHHSWYIVPTYPAWAILAAVAVKEVHSRVARTQYSGCVTTAVAVLILACQWRMIMHIEVHARMPPSQLFLASLRELRAAAADTLNTNFTPTYSERFLLQVTDGFRLNEVGLVDWAGARAESPGELLLVRLDGGPGSMNLPPGVAVIAQCKEYAVIRRSAVAQAPAAEG